MIPTSHAPLFSEQRSNIFGALARGQGAMGRAFKDSVNPAFRSKFTSLASVLDAVLPAYNSVGLSIVQHPSLEGDTVTLTTLVTHESGEWMQSSCSLTVGGKRDAHAVGSAISYLRRYTVASICGVIQSDDDGNEASAPRPAPQAAPAPAPAPTPARATEEQPRATYARPGAPPRAADATPFCREEIAESLAGLGLMYTDLADYCMHFKNVLPENLPAHSQRLMLSWCAEKPWALRDWCEQRTAAVPAPQQIPEGSEQAVMDALNQHAAVEALGAKAVRAPRGRKATDGGVA